MTPNTHEIYDRAADAAAGLSVGATIVAWLPIVNGALQIIATVVAIVAGVMAARWHYLRIKQLKE